MVGYKSLSWYDKFYYLFGWFMGLFAFQFLIILWFTWTHNKESNGIRTFINPSTNKFIIWYGAILFWLIIIGFGIPILIQLI